MQRVELLALPCGAVVHLQQNVHRVEHDAAGAHGLDLVSEHGQQPLDGEVAGHHGLGIHACVQEAELVSLLERRQVPSPAPGVLTHGGRAFLEHHQNARRAGEGPVEQALQAHDALPAPRTAADQRHASPRQTSRQHQIQTLDSGRELPDLASLPSWAGYASSLGSVLWCRHHRPPRAGSSGPERLAPTLASLQEA